LGGTSSAAACDVFACARKRASSSAAIWSGRASSIGPTPRTTAAPSPSSFPPTRAAISFKVMDIATLRAEEAGDSACGAAAGELDSLATRSARH
jgi:hypothetical protein